MRIDKFLKVSRIIKRREISKELCDDGDVFLNGKKAKPMAEVKEGDELYLILGRHRLTLKVLSVRPNATKEQASSMTEILKDEVVEKNA